MSDDLSPVLSLPLIQPAQAQKHVTHNEALRLLDVLVQPAVQGRSTASPPGFPAEGARWIVPAGATGAWAGQDGAIALHEGGGWTFLAPQPGWQVLVIDEGAPVHWTGSAWQAQAERAQRFPQLGIATEADAVNRLAVSAPATLLTHAGAGHQLKLNKAAPGDTASLLFQTGWSGRAEMGTAGSDGFAIKVSADGSAWTTALTIAGATGLVGGAAVMQSSHDVTAGRLARVQANGGIFGWGNTGTTPYIADLNSNATASGLWRVGGEPNTIGTRPAGFPASGFGQVMVLSDSANNMTQLLVRNAGTLSSLWIRKYVVSTTSWTSWLHLYSPESVVGSVSQAGGVPTGAVIERGSNANGDYLRFADGSQICWRVLTGSTGAASSWTFPAAFVAAPIVAGAAVATVQSAVCLDAAPGTTACTLSARGAGDARRADVMHVTARGRWF